MAIKAILLLTYFLWFNEVADTNSYELDLVVQAGQVPLPPAFLLAGATLPLLLRRRR